MVKVCGPLETVPWDYGPRAATGPLGLGRDLGVETSQLALYGGSPRGRALPSGVWTAEHQRLCERADTD